MHKTKVISAVCYAPSEPGSLWCHPRARVDGDGPDFGLITDISTSLSFTFWARFSFHILDLQNYLTGLLKKTSTYQFTLLILSQRITKPCQHMDFFYLTALCRQPYQAIFKSGYATAAVLVSALDVLSVLINTDQLLILIFFRIH